MVRAIMKDVLFLKKKAVPATKDDMPVVQDLLDTLKANETGCVGMAANMIGVNKRIIAVNSMSPQARIVAILSVSDITRA